MRKGTVLKQPITEELHRRHPLLPCIIEELKQQFCAKAAKIKRIQRRSERYHLNRLFGNNQRQFYRNLQFNPDGQWQTRCLPGADKETCLDSWKNIWEMPVEHDSDAEWLPRHKGEHQTGEEGAEITTSWPTLHPSHQHMGSSFG